MAGRLFLPPGGHLEVNVIGLYGAITFGSTGAVASSSGKGIASVVRNSTGNYTVTLSDSYNALLWAGVALLDSAASDPSTVGVLARIYSQDMSAKTVSVQFYAADDGAAADPASGAQALLKFELRNSSVS